MDLSVVIELVKMQPYEDMLYCEHSRSIKTRTVSCPGYTDQQLGTMRCIAFELAARKVFECGCGLAVESDRYHVNLQSSDGSGKMYFWVKGDKSHTAKHFSSVEEFRKKIKEIENEREPVRDTD